MRSKRLIVPLNQEMQREYERLRDLIASLPACLRSLKTIKGTKEMLSIGDLIAYQIGWGKCVIRWYEAGIKGEMPQMPGEGFSTWNYSAIAKHFHENYAFDCPMAQDKVFDEVVWELYNIIEKEHKNGNLEKVGIWPWCTLSSGKQWPLSKWIRVNTCAPYKRAYSQIRKNLQI